MRVLPKDLYHIFLNAAMASAISCIVLSSIGGPSSFRSSITASVDCLSASGCLCWLVEVPASEAGVWAVIRCISWLKYQCLKRIPHQQSAPFPAVPEDAPSPGCFPGRLQYLLQTSSPYTAGLLPQSAPPFSPSRSGSLRLPNAPDFSCQTLS